MIQSMTGFGHALLSSDNYKVTVELKSLNSKFLELNVKLPQSHGEEELALRNYMNQRLKRGKIMGGINIEVLNPERVSLNVNESVVLGYAEELKALATKLGVNDAVSLEFLLGLPQAMIDGDSVEDPEEWQIIESAVKEATEALVVSRTREGIALEQDLRTRCDFIMHHLGDVQKLLPVRVEIIRARLSGSLAEIKDKTSIDENRFEQEILYYLEKLDINEEIVRLRKHLDYFDSTLRENESNGRRLGFIAQEMGREINTIGSKANDAAMQVCVVKMKEELEKIKEQLNNIL